MPGKVAITKKRNYYTLLDLLGKVSYFSQILSFSALDNISRTRSDESFANNRIIQCNNEHSVRFLGKGYAMYSTINSAIKNCMIWSYNLVCCMFNSLFSAQRNRKFTLLKHDWSPVGMSIDICWKTATTLDSCSVLQSNPGEILFYSLILSFLIIYHCLELLWTCLISGYRIFNGYLMSFTHYFHP